MPSWIAELVRLDGDGRMFRTSMALGAGPRLFGGLIAAQALAAAAATVGADRLPQSLHAYFIRGGRVGVDVEYTVDTTRDGRSFTTRRVTAGQDGVPIFEMLASFHVPETTVDWQRPTPLRLPLSAATTEVRPRERWADYYETRVGAGTTPEWPPAAVLVSFPRADRGRSGLAGLCAGVRLRSGSGLHRPPPGPG